MKVAIVYDRVNTWGGAERVLLVLHELFPDAPLYTSVYNPETSSWARVFSKVYTSFLQKIPGVRKRHELFGWIMGFAFEQFNFDGYDMVISVTSEAAKGIITGTKTTHICYCLTPTRYLWSGYREYFQNSWLRWIAWPVVWYMKTWDKIAAQRPDVMVGISKEVSSRIKQYYGRNVEVIYPPVEMLEPTRVPAAVFPPRTPMRGPILGGSPNHATHSLGISDVYKHIPENYFLIVNRLVPYKKVDLAIKAFNQLGLPLVIVGTGRDEKHLKRMAGKNIQFVGKLTNNDLALYYTKATALIFPQNEDFGITAVEAQLMGIPVIAYKSGGATETIIEGKTGIFFTPQTSDALAEAVQQFFKDNFDSTLIKHNGQRFSKEKFKTKFIMYLRKTTAVKPWL